MSYLTSNHSKVSSLGARRAARDAEQRITVRHATADDAGRIRMLAALDSRKLPNGPWFVAEADDEIVALIPVAGGTVVADPFRRTADLVALLELRAAQLAETPAESAGLLHGVARALRPAAA
jgi:hypothetical protein